MRIYKQFIKRPLDIIGALVLMILTFPLFVLVWILIKIFMGSPVMLPQKRAGLHGKIFTLYKFRTMSFEKDPSGKLLPDEMRITKLGAFLRKTSLDEIPQFYNVLKGDMSFIGPRPFMEEEIKALSKKSFRRHNVLPGLSGLAQISGRNEITVEEKISKDLEYVDNISFLLDAKIFIITLIKVLLCIDSTPINKNRLDNTKNA